MTVLTFSCDAGYDVGNALTGEISGRPGYTGVFLDRSREVDLGSTHPPTRSLYCQVGSFATSMRPLSRTVSTIITDIQLHVVLSPVLYIDFDSTVYTDPSRERPNKEGFATKLFG